MKKMKSGKAGGPSGVVADMLKAGGDTVVDCFTDLCNGIVKEGRIPNDWTKSIIIIVHHLPFFPFFFRNQKMENAVF